MAVRIKVINSPWSTFNEAIFILVTKFSNVTELLHQIQTNVLMDGYFLLFSLLPRFFQTILDKMDICWMLYRIRNKALIQS